MLNRDNYVQHADWRNPKIPSYTIVEAATAPTAWRIAYVYHLMPDENRGKHVIMIDVLDTGGRWGDASGLTVGWTWNGRRPDEPAPPRAFEKRPPEPRANVDLYKGQITSLWINDSMGIPSDKIHGLHSDVENLPSGNTFGHNSFLVFFQLVTRPVVIVPPDPPTEPPLSLEWLAMEVATLKRRIDVLEGNGR